LKVFQALLNDSLVLVQLHVCFTLSDNVLLQLLRQGFRAAHLAYCSSGNVFLLSQSRLELQKFAVVSRSIAHGRRVGTGEVFEPLCRLL
jgi:hypothetical protein